MYIFIVVLVVVHLAGNSFGSTGAWLPSSFLQGEFESHNKCNCVVH